MGLGYQQPLIDYFDGKFRHNSEACAIRVKKKEKVIRVGCSYITFRAVEELMGLVKKHDFKEEIVVQP